LLLHDAGVGCLVALFVGGDGSTEARQYVVSARPGEVRGVAV
jgi:hypothetical protein